MSINLKRLISRLVLIGTILVALWVVFLYGTKLVIIGSTYLPEEQHITSFIDLEEYEVYSSIIEISYVSPTTELILIDNKTGLGWIEYEDISPDYPYGYGEANLSDELGFDFYIKNSEQVELTKSFKLSKPYLLVDESNRENLNRLLLITNNIENTAFLEFSRVGFNSKKDEAFVHVSFLGLGDRLLGYSTFAMGNFYYLKKMDGHWEIQGEWESYIT